MGLSEKSQIPDGVGESPKRFRCLTGCFSVMLTQLNVVPNLAPRIILEINYPVDWIVTRCQQGGVGELVVIQISTWSGPSPSPFSSRSFFACG